MYNEKNREHTYKWRENHKEQYNSYTALKMKEQYDKNRLKKIQKVLARYYEKQEFKRFLKILL